MSLTNHDHVTDAVPSYLAERDAAIAPERLARSKAFSANLIASGAAGRALPEGAPAPDFALPDVRGTTVRLSELLRRGPAVVTFYRGAWCPYCNLQLRAYQRTLPQIAARGATLVAISPQLPDGSLNMAERNELAFPVLSDVGNVVARQYGLVFQLEETARERYLAMGNDLAVINGDDSWELPMPGTFVIAPDGIVRFAFVPADYTERLEPAAVLAALDELRRP